MQKLEKSLLISNGIIFSRSWNNNLGHQNLARESWVVASQFFWSTMHKEHLSILQWKALLSYIYILHLHDKDQSKCVSGQQAVMVHIGSATSRHNSCTIVLFTCLSLTGFATHYLGIDQRGG